MFSPICSCVKLHTRVVKLKESELKEKLKSYGVFEINVEREEGKDTINTLVYART